MTTERRDLECGGVAWRSDLVTWRDAEVQHRNAGNPQTAEDEDEVWGGAKSDRFSSKTFSSKSSQQTDPL